jgi:hypothetical protein
MAFGIAGHAGLYHRGVQGCLTALLECVIRDKEGGGRAEIQAKLDPYSS